MTPPKSPDIGNNTTEGCEICGCTDCEGPLYYEDVDIPYHPSFNVE